MSGTSMSGKSVLPLALLLASVAAAPQAEPAKAIPVPAARQAPPANSEYRIGLNDTLEISVFQVPELSQTVQVDTQGGFVLPIVGRVPAVGKTTGELTSFLTGQLQGRYLKDPLITVSVKEAATNRVTVDGAVVKPGVYPLAGPTTLMQAVALANGPDARVANMRKVTLFRSVDGRRGEQTFDLVKIREGKAPDPPVVADDIVVVEASGTRSFFTYYGSILPMLALFRPF